MPNTRALPTRSATRTHNMNISRARHLEESWEITCETLVLFIGTLKDADLHHENNLEDMFGEIEDIMDDLPARREWTQIHLFKLCSMPTGNCPVKQRIKIATNGWKTICESFYVIADLAKDIVAELCAESIIEFKNSIRDIFTEERLSAAQDGAPFEFCVDGYDDNWNIIPADQAVTAGEDEWEDEVDTDEEGEETTEDEETTDEEDDDFDEMPDLEPVDNEHHLNDDFDEMPDLEPVDNEHHRHQPFNNIFIL